MKEELLPGVPIVNQTRWARFLETIRELLPEGEPEVPLEEAQAEEEMKDIARGRAPPDITASPSNAGMLAAPVVAAPEPINQAAALKPVNAKIAPQKPVGEEMSTRVASADPFYDFLRSKFASLYEDGTPSLYEAAGMGLGALGGVHAGNALAPMGASGSAKSKLAPNLEGMGDFLTGSSAERRVAREMLDRAAAEHGLHAPRHLFWNDSKVLSGAKSLEKELAHKITEGRRLPLKALGGGLGLLGSAYLLRELSKERAQLAAAEQGY